MRLASLRIAQLRTHPHAELPLTADLTLVDGPNGAGKTNLLEALVLATTGRSWRTRTDRELVRHGEDAGRAELTFADQVGATHRLSLTAYRGQQERVHTLDGSRVDLASERPQIVVFAPDRLALVQGSPQGRRAHLDQLTAGLWPARAAARASYRRALAQRNALLHRPSAPGIDTWEAELGRYAMDLRDARSNAVAQLGAAFAAIAQDLGLPGVGSVAYRSSDEATTAEELAALLASRRDRDRERGFTTVGPHRDELLIRRDDRDLRSFGSQGEQRLAVLALLLAERQLLTEVRGRSPVALLDDVGSELDPERRRRLVEHVCSAGQVIIATTSATELGGHALPASTQHVRVTPVQGAEIPTSAITREAADGLGAPATIDP